MLATVPSCGATTGVSIFMISNTRTASPFFTAWPTEASILNTFPAAPASILTLPAPPAGAVPSEILRSEGLRGQTDSRRAAVAGAGRYIHDL